MPRKSSVAKQKRAFRSKEEIQRILSEVSAAQANGATLTAALKALNISYNTFNNWLKKFGAPAKASAAAAPQAKVVAKKGKGKGVASKTAKTRKARTTSAQKEEMRQRDQALKVEGKTTPEIAKILGVSVSTLYTMRKQGKTASAAKPQSRIAAVQQVQLSPDNPMYQLALTHERLMAMNKQIDLLTAERDKLAGEMQAMMKKVAEVCPALKWTK